VAQIALRSGEKSDFPLILDAFWKSYSLSHHAKGVPAHWLRRLMLPLLDSWQIVCAVAADDPDEVLGFVVYRDTRTIAWVHVKERYRRRGVAAALLAFVGVRKGEVFTPFLATHLEDGASFPKIAHNLGYTVRFRPYLSMDRDENTATKQASQAA
jgi:GNAT superfamily N-acetyltransferase